MPRTETTEVTYDVQLREGVRECNSAGVIYDSGTDKPFMLRLQKVTKVIVRDGRGRNWQDSAAEAETVADLSIEQASTVVKALVDNLAYAAEVAERRVLVLQPKEA
jgi:hypothetical protein